VKTRLIALVLASTAALIFAGCTHDKAQRAATKQEKIVPVVQPSVGLQTRFGDEIVVAGQFYRTGAPVVTWMDKGGYDAYRVERRFVPYEKSSWDATTQAVADAKAAGRGSPDIENPARYNLRYQRSATQRYSPRELEQVRGGGWDLDLLQKHVDQFVLHYDVCGTSRQCFNILHDHRGLSVHFMLDLDGTIYQTLDLKERAWHATTSNDRSIGIEIANMGSYSIRSSPAPLVEWYQKDEDGKTFIQIPQRLGGMDSQRVKDAVLRPMRNDPVEGEIHGSRQRMYDLTPQQYDSLIKLTAALCDVFPQIKCDYPRGPDGMLLLTNLQPEALEAFQGVLGHFHIQRNKSDPGPALQWDYVIDNARRLLDERRTSAAATD
jgi:N-acetyl-anhydromuramyl-L-alanine amidase AmpD